MRKPALQKRRWRIGELARAAGVTVRALHHYEESGLLASAERTSGDHRLYDEAGVERLYRIRVLRGLGLSLEEIRQAIDCGAALPDVLRTQLTRVEEDVSRLMRLRDRLRGLAGEDSQVGAEDLLATLDAMAHVQRVAQSRRGAAGQGGAGRWCVLGEELRACMAAGAAPSSPQVRALAREARDLIHAFARGDAATLAALARVRAADPPRDLAGWDPELTRYLDRALGALEGEP